MATLHGKDTAVALLDRDASGLLHSVTGPGTDAADEDSVFGLDDKTYIGGLADGSVSFAGRYGKASPTDLLTELLGIDVGVVATFGGHGVGKGGVAAYGPCTVANPTAPVAGVVDWAGTVMRGGPSYTLHDGSAIAAAADLASFDLVGSGTVGRLGGDAFGIVVVTAVTASSFTVKLQHSVDDSVWVDLLDFGALAAVGGSGVAAGLAFGVDLRRFIRCVVGGTGTSISFVPAVIPLNA